MAIETDFLPIDYDYFDFAGRNYVRVVGRNSKGKRICIVDTCPVFLWAILRPNLPVDKITSIIKKVEKITVIGKTRETRVEKVELHDKNFLSKPVQALKIFATNYKDLHDVADCLDFPEIDARRGYDLGFITHYIMEKNLTPLTWHTVSGEEISNSDDFGKLGPNLDVDLCLRVKSFKKIEEKRFTPKVLAYDIEADEIKIGDGEILMISLVSDDFKKVITWKKPGKGESKANHDFVEHVKDEAALLEKFVEYAKKISPDFLVGYFSDGFDLPYLKARADKLRVPLRLGLDGSQPKFSRGVMTTGKISGMVHVDLLRFIETAYSQYMQSETLSLNEVANEFLGDKKKQHTHVHSSKLDGEGWDHYYEYNLHDSVLTFGLFEKMWPDISEFTRIMQEPVFSVTRNGMSSNVEDYIIHNLARFGEIPERRPKYEEISERRHKEKYEGAFVFEPIPGLYENVAVFDFTSNYGTTIVTYNLSKSTFLPKKTADAHCIELEGRTACFSKEPGFFPEMLKEIIEKRKQYKKELKTKPDAIKQARSNAFKLLANAAYGYQGFFGARYYLREAAAATAAFAKKMIKEVIEKINEEGFKVVYSDTDSIAFLMDKKDRKHVLSFLDELNEELPGIMELELESFYTRGIWVTKRTGAAGAKKKYALIDENKRLKIRGFETVRRDWCRLARNMQNNVIRQILEDGNHERAFQYVKDIIKKVKQREVPREDILIKTMLRKPIEEYKAISPHVIAAKKMHELGLPISGGNLIEFFIAETREKKALVRDKVKLADEKGEYNIKYYLEHQILPAVESIFQVFGINMQEIMDGKKQMKLGDF